MSEFILTKDASDKYSDQGDVCVLAQSFIRICRVREDKLITNSDAMNRIIKAEGQTLHYEDSAAFPITQGNTQMIETDRETYTWLSNGKVNLYLDNPEINLYEPAIYTNYEPKIYVKEKLIDFEKLNKPMQWALQEEFARNFACFTLEQGDEWINTWLNQLRSIKSTLPMYIQQRITKSINKGYF